MSYIIAKVDQISRSDFDNLWEDCKAEVDGKTHLPDHCEQIFTGINTMPLNLSVTKEGKLISFLSGEKKDKGFFITIVLHGKDKTDSKSWLYDSDYWTAIKTYLSNNSMNGYGGEIIKNESAYNHIKRVVQNGIYPDVTLEESDEIVKFNRATSIIWLNHN